MSAFLTARWEHLVMLNYLVDPAVLAPLVPVGTTLDDWRGRTHISLVGFMFRDTQLRGRGIPWHRTFEEVNLRFYVRRTTPDGEIRRGVVFIRELVPRTAIALVARWIYNEPYLAVPMSHLVPGHGGLVRYAWRYRGGPYAIEADIDGTPRVPDLDSEPAFIAEHYWGYTRQRDGGTVEYRVEHPAWRVWTPARAAFTGDATALYGRTFASALDRPPHSALVAEGSSVVVHAPVPVL